MKCVLLCLLSFTLVACNPFPKDEEEMATPRKTAVSPTPTPTPKPGAWMTEERDNPLGIKSKPLAQKPSR